MCKKNLVEHDEENEEEYDVDCLLNIVTEPITVILKTQFQKNHEHDEDVENVECPDKRNDDGSVRRWETGEITRHHPRCRIFPDAPVKWLDASWPLPVSSVVP